LSLYLDFDLSLRSYLFNALLELFVIIENGRDVFIYLSSVATLSITIVTDSSWNRNTRLGHADLNGELHLLLGILHLLDWDLKVLGWDLDVVLQNGLLGVAELLLLGISHVGCWLKICCILLIFHLR
jgi:hypothetical protein